MNTVISIKNLHVSVDNKKILNGINLDISAGKIHAIMGQNGSGKSSLAQTIMGHPSYTITQGTIACNGNPIHNLSPDKRAKQGIFLALQHPYEIDGVSYKDFLRQAYNALYDGTSKQLRIRDFHKMLLEKVEFLKMDKAVIDRHVNVGFSGGEKKRAEMLQLAVLQPQIAILDEIDSGLDIDALNIVCKGLHSIRKDNPNMSIILITHYQKILEYIQPDVVHVMHQGTIAQSGQKDLAEKINQQGFDV